MRSSDLDSGFTSLRVVLASSFTSLRVVLAVTIPTQF